MFGHDLALDVYYTVLDYAPRSYEDDRVEVSIAQLPRLETWIATVVNCLTERERREDYRQKMYANTYACYVTAAIGKLVGRVGLLLDT